MKPVYATFDQDALDREYSPSSCIDDLDVYLDEYARTSKAAKSDALIGNACDADQRYGPGAEETLDLFLPAERGLAPLHVFIHGGYWQLLSKDESCFSAPMFQQHGSLFAALNYTLANSTAACSPLLTTRWRRNKRLPVSSRRIGGQSHGYTKMRMIGASIASASICPAIPPEHISP